MATLNDVLAANRDAANDLIAAAERCSSDWAVPRAPGKWSPSQVVEHVARALEESANVVKGAPSKFPTLPFFLRLLMRLFFNRVLKNQAFPKAKTNRAMNPASGPPTPAEARIRLEAALTKFEQECRAQSTSARYIMSATFGQVLLEDYVRFQEIHTRHHCKQLPPNAGAG